MTPQHLKQAFLALTALALASSAWADVVETTNGARLVGKVTSIDGTVVYLKTDYAGDLKIKQSDVAKVTTDAPLVVRLASGTVLQGTLSAPADNSLVITGPDGTLTTKVDKVAATWAPGAVDPALIELQRHWTYEATVDVSGKSGNKNQLATAFAARATMKTKQDTLQFYTAYDREVSEGVKSADQFKAGIDYQNNFSGRYSWYVRDEAGFDRIKAIDLYDIAGAGLGYDFIKEPKHTLTIRAGLSYQYEGYKDDAAETVNSAGLDFGLEHVFAADNWSLTNRLTVDPTFEDFGNFRILHESFFEIPLQDPAWKLRLGVSNDYSSKPVAGTKKLDTTYFTRFVIDWK